MKEILEKLAKRLDLVTLGGLVLFLVIAITLLLKEQNYQLPQLEDPAPRDWDNKFKENKNYTFLTKNYIEIQPDINKDETARRVIQNNMFDLKSVAESTEGAEESNRAYNQAEKLFQEKKYADARRVLDQVLARDPNHKESQDLKRKIDSLTGAAK